MPSIQIDTIDFYYEVHGVGEPLMLVAGLASDSQSWEPIIEGLSAHYMVITPDNRGTGRTVPQDVETSIGHMADDCMVLARHLGLSSFNLLGHSMGGFIALDISTRYPNAVSRLILAGTSTFNPKRNKHLFSDWVSTFELGMDKMQWFRTVFYWVFTERFFESSEVVNTALHYAVDYPYSQSEVAFRKQVEAITDFDCSGQLSSVTAKTLIICGEEDILFPPDRTVPMLQVIQGAGFSIIKDAAHSIHMEQPQIFTDCVVDFLYSNS